MAEPLHTNVAAHVVFQNIANLLRVGTFQGLHAAIVHDSIVFLEKMAEEDKKRQPLAIVPDEAPPSQA